MLGHVEVSAAQTWQVAPPVLAVLPQHGHAEWQAVLCGARTQGVLQSLQAAGSEAGAPISRVPIDGAPDLVRADAPSQSALAKLAETAGVPLQHNAALTLLACTPTIADWPRTPCAMVRGRVDTVLRFSRSKVTWVESSLEEASQNAGFYRIRRDWDWVYILKSTASASAYIDVRAGRIAALSKRRVVSWDQGSWTLSLPGQLLPPTLIARSLALCTGALPNFTDREVQFAGVPPLILQLTLAITGLRRR